MLHITVLEMRCGTGCSGSVRASYSRTAAIDNGFFAFAMLVGATMTTQAARAHLPARSVSVRRYPHDSRRSAGGGDARA
jgi:uncharacterized protein YfiM (DUF2279 family)